MAVSLNTPTRVAQFRYRAATANGRIECGVLLATSAAAATSLLAERGLAAVRVEARGEGLFRRRVSQQDVAVVFRNVATLVAVGVPIERALAASEPIVSPALAASIAEVRKLIREGRSASAALEALPDVFPRSAVGVVRAAERGGSLIDACAAVAQQLEETAQIRGRVRAAMAYPLLILLVGVATVAVMAGVVVPRFATILSDLGSELPPATRALLFASDLVKRGAVLLVPALVIGAPMASRWLRTPSTRARMDRLFLRVPVVSPIRLGFASARVCRALGGMLGNGMPLLAALDSVSDATGDAEITRRLAAARDAVARGMPLTDALRDEDALSPTALQLVGVGESSGSLAPMLGRAATVVGEHAERSLRTAVALLEPALVVALGVIVTGVAAALLQAVYGIRPLS